MYVTRPLSLYRASPEAASAQPPEGPHSGYLVIQDEEYEAQARCCWGLCANPYLRDLPFPQNRMLTVEYTSGSGEHSHTTGYDVFFFPVPGLPLSSNRYYVVRAKRTHAGKVCTCSREEDKRTCCFCSCVNDVKPQPFDHRNVYQQVEILPYAGCSRGHFYAKSVAPDGFPTHFLRQKGWRIYTSLPRNRRLDLGEAHGVDAALRARMPDTSFPASSLRSPAVVVGKWYCPFVFVKEECPPKDQMKRSVFYELTLEQFWEAVHTSEELPGEGRRKIRVSVGVQGELPLLSGCEPVGGVSPAVDGVVWFRPAKGTGGGGVGLSTTVMEGMRWEQRRGGWLVAEKDGVGRVEREEEEEEGWGRFVCYVLVERFALRRLDGSVVLTYDYKHVNKVITKWG